MCAWDGDSTPFKVIELNLVCPPVLLLSVGAEHLEAALRKHPVYYTINALLAILRKRAATSLQYYEMDSAKGNERWYQYQLWAHKSDAELRQFFVSFDILIYIFVFVSFSIHFQTRWIFSGWSMFVVGSKTVLYATGLRFGRCRNHQNHIVQVAVLDSIGLRLINRLYGTAVFLRTGNYFMRLVSGLRDWVSRDLEIKIGEPPMLAQLYSREVRSLMESLRNLTDRGIAEQVGGSGEALVLQSFKKQKKRTVHDEFFRIWNGEWWVSHPVTYLGADKLCKDKEHIIAEMHLYLQKFGFSSAPDVPAPNKWLKLLGMVEWACFGICCHNAIESAMNFGFGNLTFREYVPYSDKEFLDTKLVADLQFNAISGKRCEQARAVFSSEDTKFALVLLAVALEGQQHLQAVYLASYHHPYFSGCSTPARALCAMFCSTSQAF